MYTFEQAKEIISSSKNLADALEKIAKEIVEVRGITFYKDQTLSSFEIKDDGTVIVSLESYRCGESDWYDVHFPYSYFGDPDWKKRELEAVEKKRKEREQQEKERAKETKKQSEK